MALGAVAGCSFALSGPDPQRPKNAAPECDTGKGLVGLDGLIGATLGITGLALLNDNGGAAAVTGLLGLAFIGSAVRGNTAVNECRTALEAYHQVPYEPPMRDEPRVARRPHVTPSEPPPSEGPRDPYVTTHAPPLPTIAPPPAPGVVAPVTPPARPAVPAKPAPAPPPEADDWKDFWTEVP